MSFKMYFLFHFVSSPILAEKKKVVYSHANLVFHIYEVFILLGGKLYHPRFA